MKLKVHKNFLFVLMLCFFLFALGAVIFPRRDLNATANETENSPAQGTSSEYALVLNDCKLINASALEKIIDPNGKEVAFKGATFKPLTVGIYTLVYKTESKILNVLFKSENMTFSFENIFDGSYNAGEKVVFPTVRIKDDYAIYDTYDVIVSYAGEQIRKITNVTNADEFSYRFQNSGAYEIEYACMDIFGQVFISEPLTVTVVDEPIILCDPIESTVQNFSTIDFGYPYGYYKNNLYEVDLFVTYPSGEKEELKDSYLVVDELGLYTIEYCSVMEGVKTFLSQSFEVVKPSSAWFVNAGTVQSNMPLPAYSKVQGSAPLLKNDANFRANYFNVVDLSKLSNTQNVISFVPYSTDKYYMGGVTVTLTDIYDETNYLQINWFNVPRWGTTHSYLTVVRNGTAYGISNESKTYLQTRTIYGTVANDCSFRGATDGVCDTYNMQWDFENNQLYTYIRGKQWMVLDTDDDTVMSLKDRFYGFTTGEVYVSVQTSENTGGGLYMLEVGGKSLVGEKETIGYDEYLILFDRPDVELPVGAINYPYPINIRARINGMCADKPEIFSAIYKDGNKITTERIVENFIPEQAGDYEIVWRTVYQGETVEKRLPFTIEATPRTMQMNLPSGETIMAGSTYTLPELDITGGAGGYNVSYKVYNEDGEFQSNAYGEYQFDTGKDVIVEIIVIDQIGYQQKFSYTIEIDVGSTRLVLSDSVPRTMRTGEQVTLPNFEAINYAAYTDLEKKIVVNDTIVLTQAPFTFTVPEDKMLSVRYIAGEGTEYETSEEYAVRVIPTVAETYDLLGVEASQAILLENGLLVKADLGGKLLEMPYALPMGEMYLKFALNEAEMSFERLCLTLKDTNNENKTVSVQIGNIASGIADLYINGIKAKNQISYTENTYSHDCGNANYAETKYYLFEFVFDGVAHCIETPDGIQIASFDSFSNGNAFNGFAKNIAYIDFSLQGVSSEASIVLGCVGNQAFGYYLDLLELPDNDNMGPMIYADQQITDIQGVFGSDYTIPVAYARDVLQAYSGITVTVKAPDGSTLFNRVPLSNSIEIRLSDYGMYAITYEAIDALGNVAKRFFSVNVLDDEEPAVTVSGAYQTVYKLGEDLKIQAATVSDNTLDGMELTIFYKNSYGLYTIVEAGKTVNLERCGVQAVIYRAVDKFGNVSLVVYEFTVNV